MSASRTERVRRRIAGLLLAVLLLAPATVPAQTLDMVSEARSRHCEAHARGALERIAAMTPPTRQARAGIAQMLAPLLQTRWRATADVPDGVFEQVVAMMGGQARALRDAGAMFERRLAEERAREAACRRDPACRWETTPDSDIDSQIAGHRAIERAWRLMIDGWTGWARCVQASRAGDAPETADGAAARPGGRPGLVLGEARNCGDRGFSVRNGYDAAIAVFYRSSGNALLLQRAIAPGRTGDFCATLETDRAQYIGACFDADAACKRACSRHPASCPR